MLAATRNNVSEVSRKCKIPGTTLRHWLKGDYIKIDITEKGDIKKALLADQLEQLAYSLVSSIDADKIGEAALQQIATSLGIVIDKMRLLREQPTAITAGTQTFLNDLSDDELDRRIAVAESRKAPSLL